MSEHENMPEDELIHLLLPSTHLSQHRTDLQRMVGEVVDLVTQAHKPYGGTTAAYYYAALAEYFQRLLLGAEASASLPAWIEQQALDAHIGDESISVLAPTPEAQEEWQTFRQEERWRILGRVGQAADQEMRRLLEHPVVGRLSLNDFTKLADTLGSEVSWACFIGTWHALEQATGRSVSVEEVVSQCLASALLSLNSANDELFSELETVSAVKQHGDMLLAYAKLGEAFKIEKPHLPPRTAEQELAYNQALIEFEE